MALRKIIFACVHSAGRSQMCAAYFNKLCDSSNFFAVAAGTQPAQNIHPEVIDIMKEVGIDLSKAKPQLLTEALARDAVLLVTLGCGENCPYVPGLKVIDWPLRDPKGKDSQIVRLIRDEIKEKVEFLIASLPELLSSN